MTLSVGSNVAKEPNSKSHPLQVRRRRLLISEAGGFSSQALAQLRAFAEVTCADVNRAELLSMVAAAEVLWVRLRHHVDAEVIRNAPRLRVLVTPTTGLNHIDLEAARAAQVRVLSLRGETEFLKNVRATAELTIGLMLALSRHLPAANSHVLSGGWNRDLFKGTELHRKTVGIVGYGRLGRIVARYLQAFDAHVLAADPHLPEGESDDGVRLVGLDTLLSLSDVVSLHVNLCADTHRFFGEKQFRLMRRNAWFINTARGELVEEAALLGALQSGHLSGAALDVLADEQPQGMTAHPLVAYAREHANLIITPHIGGCTHESMADTELFLARKLEKVLADTANSTCSPRPSAEGNHLPS